MKDNLIKEYAKQIKKKENTINFCNYFKNSGRTYKSKVFQKKLTINQNH